MMPWIISVLLFLTCYEACIIVPQPVILFPLNAEYQTRDIKNRTAPGIPSGVSLAPGPYGEEDGSYEFFRNASSFIEFPNSPGSALDVRYSMTILCWVYYDEKGGPHGPIFNYNTGGKYGVHLWVSNRLLFARFNDRSLSESQTYLHHTSLAGGWKFVGASYDNETGETKLWAEGAFKQTLNMGAGVILGTQGSVRMGVRKNDNRYFKGKISQLQIYNEALSQQQIIKIATKPKEPCRQLEFISDNIFQGYNLQNHVIRTIQNINEDFCGALCFMEYNCVSFNVKVTGGPGTSAICQLNNSTHHANLGDLQTLENSIYHGITENPCDESLCQHSSTCQAGFTEKGYRCLCSSGFCGEHCETDIDECYAGNECSINALCHNLHGSYNCTCKEGYYGDGKNCRDIDECYAGNECSANALCHNLHGSYNCTCKEGYYGDGKNCRDIDECYPGNECSVNALCHNLHGSYKCTCKEGYYGDGKNCRDIDECYAGNECSANALCHNLHGSYNCTCKEGYYGDGKNCRDIDECYAGNECSANALCHNLHGSYNCTCKEGYYGDGKNCKAGSSCKNIKAIIGEEAINGRYFLVQNGVKFEVYCHIESEDQVWTLIARSSNNDFLNWMRRKGQWWFTAETSVGQTASTSANSDLLSPAFWLVSGHEFKITRSDDPQHTALLRTSDDCLGGQTFRAKITSYGRFTNEESWEIKPNEDGCRGSCSVSYAGRFEETVAFKQANCSGEIQSAKKIGFWCAIGSSGSVMMIGGGGQPCTLGDHGIGITSANDRSFSHAPPSKRNDFGDVATSSPETAYSLNLWIQ
ncbi:PREDICTED: uncharacterized protein LOC107337224 isoform X2 [Acropora digitifera]|uniref:uncharacterized protein LOC107337224 isoform X2 n=1 Tax=Acropora digitifera TaxID=70779 RepID=UPI00077A6455|nr:PREDICTED: uncharacterized protein LOC107337224 isoform X2 [Acropora digitifera]